MFNSRGGYSFLAPPFLHGWRFFFKVGSSSDLHFVLPLVPLCVCTCRPVYLQTSFFGFVAMQQLGKYRCGCGALISNVGKAEREHCKSDRHQKWLKSQQTTKTLSAFFVKGQNPVGSSSSSSSSINTSNNCNTNSSSSNANSSSGSSNSNASSSSSNANSSSGSRNVLLTGWKSLPLNRSRLWRYDGQNGYFAMGFKLMTL